MPRLDVWLIQTGQFSSRQAAKRAIKNGLVIVNGVKGKPSTQVSEKDSIEILGTDVDVPQGFLKLKELDGHLQDKLVCNPSTALDIGSSAGGFLTYLAEKGANVIGIEVSERFTEELTKIVDKYPQVSVIFEDAFNIDIEVISDRNQLDIILIDVTTDPDGTLKLIEKFTPLLKEGGRMLAAFKTDPSSDNISTLKDTISQLGYSQIHEFVIDETRHEVHITALYM
jgi:23S rRNA (cytidine1920-2'-O)/16S rRNA (cytidine1409-2'-O)-methyltransferase